MGAFFGTRDAIDARVAGCCPAKRGRQESRGEKRGRCSENRGPFYEPCPGVGESKVAHGLPGNFRSPNRTPLVTILRDPASRWISNFTHFVSKKQDIVPHYWEEGLSLEQMLEKCLSSWVGRFWGNMYVFMFGNDGVKFYSSESQVQALKTLRQHTLIGFVDDLSPFLNSLQSHVGVSINVKHRNRSEQHAEMNQGMYREIQTLFTDSVLEQVKDLCKADYYIYNETKNWFCPRSV